MENQTPDEGRQRRPRIKRESKFYTTPDYYREGSLERNEQANLPERRSYGDSEGYEPQRRQNHNPKSKKRIVYPTNDKRYKKSFLTLKGTENLISNKIERRRKRQTPPEPKYGDTTRLNKYISNAGVCSRREADLLIQAGAITVNGEVVTTLGYKVQAGDVVCYAGKELMSEPKRYFLLNKPRGFITTMDDPEERRTVMMLMEGCCKERIYPVGRLDRDTTGLLLFTNDGELAKKLTHPSSNIYKIYHVELDRELSHTDRGRILDGLELEDGPIKVDDVQFQNEDTRRKIVGVALHSGRNRIVRRIFEHLGYEVVKLDRVAFAGLTKKDLPRGRYRELTQREVNYLRMI